MSTTLEVKMLSSMEKCFLDSDLNQFHEYTEFTVFHNQPLVFQIGVCRYSDRDYKRLYSVQLSGELAPYARVRLVTNLPCEFPCITPHAEGEYLRQTPGLYPDLLRPLNYQNGLILMNRQTQALWITAEPLQELPAGIYTLDVAIASPEGTPYVKKSAHVRVLDQNLPPQKRIHTEWFYTDCLANAYHVPVFSEPHWHIIENFMRCAVRNGINMILTPVFTPELDTYIGGERLTTQLLGIAREADGGYTFDFTQLDRWVALCRSVGVEYLEIPHFFSQWGSLHAPKIIASVNGTEQQLFGWQTDSCGEDYKQFLSRMIPALIARLEALGMKDRIFFHISDEPQISDLAQYRRCKEMITPYLKDYPIIDALSDFDFYESGAIDKPVPSIMHIQPFLDHRVPGLWTYYCGDGGANVTGRMLAMPLSRTRILGVQLYLANIEGFLHWGFNFYNNQNSYQSINPFLFTDCEHFTPAGDGFLVYPGDNGEAWESLRLNAMREAMEDIRMLELCESVCGREETVALIQEVNGGELTFTDFPTDPGFFIRLRDRVTEHMEHTGR